MLPLSELAGVLDDLPLRSGRARASPRRFTLAGADRTPGFFRYLLKERRNDFVTSLHFACLDLETSCRPWSITRFFGWNLWFPSLNCCALFPNGLPGNY